MIEVRRFLNVAEAELAKLSLLEQGIFCELSGENSHLYGGAPFAMPISLLVESESFDEANQVLAGAGVGLPVRRPIEPAAAGKNNDPWEILALAGLLLLPAIGLLMEHQTGVWIIRRRTHLSVAWSPQVLHAIGAIILAIVIALVAFYVYLRKLIARDGASLPPAG